MKSTVPIHWPVEVSRVSAADDLREAEVGEVGVLAAEQDVGGLDVAVHEPDGVRGVERRADLAADRRHALRGQPPLAARAAPAGRSP